MNRETYLELVLKNLLCSNKEKRRIYKDLQSDIEAAIENGESWIAIQERLGTPEELAMEFNENLEVKKIDRKWVWIGSIVVILGILAICVSLFTKKENTKPLSEEPKTVDIQNSKIFKQEILEIYTSEIIDLLSQKKYEQLQSYFHLDLQVALNPETLNNAMNQLGELGNYQKITNQQYIELTDKGNTMAVGEVVALYEQRSVTYRITFDSDMKVIGLYMR